MSETVETGGRYHVIRLLGRGGMGTVYLARQTALDRDVALKVITVQENGLAEGAVARFEQEMRATARVEHPNSVRLYDSGPTGDGLYLAMEYLTGRTLREVLDAEGRLPPARAVHIAKQVARALAAAHRQRIVHRDLKPENIMLLDQFGEPDFVKVLDFGIARFLDAQTARLTGTGAVIGTPRLAKQLQTRLTTGIAKRRVPERHLPAARLAPQYLAPWHCGNEMGGRAAGIARLPRGRRPSPAVAVVDYPSGGRIAG